MSKIILPTGSEIQTGEAVFNEGNQSMKKVATVNVDATTIAVVDLYEVPTGKVFYPMYFRLRLTDYTKGSQAQFWETYFFYNDSSNVWQYGNSFKLSIDGVSTPPPTPDMEVGDYAEMVNSDNTPFAGNAVRRKIPAGGKLSIDVGSLWGTNSDATVEKWDVEVWGRLENA